MKSNIEIFDSWFASNAHERFQSWRLVHWDNGEFLHCKKIRGVNVCKLHTARCRHFELPGAPRSRSFTRFQKVCSTARQELFEWARAQGAIVEGCHCL